MPPPAPQTAAVLARRRPRPRRLRVAARPRRPGGAGKTLVIDKSFDLKTADPGRMYEPTGVMVDKALYETLLTFEGGDVTKPVPALADLEQSDDGKTLTLRSDGAHTFADGTPITADDVVFSLQRVHRRQGQSVVPARRRDGGQEGRQDGHADLQDRQPGAAVHPAQPGARHPELQGGQGARRHRRRR